MIPAQLAPALARAGAWGRPSASTGARVPREQEEEGLVGAGHEPGQGSGSGIPACWEYVSSGAAGAAGAGLAVAVVG